MTSYPGEYSQLMTWWSAMDYPGQVNNFPGAPRQRCPVSAPDVVAVESIDSGI